MILKNCPQLEKLTLGGCESFVTSRHYGFDIRPLFQGRWPNLNSLIIDYTSLKDVSDDFNIFLLHHPKIKHLHIPYQRGPVALTDSNLTLESYSGNLPKYVDLEPFRNLKTLSICSRPHSYNEVTGSILPALSFFNSLTTLEIWIDLVYHTRHASKILLRSVFGRCTPQLLHLTILCSTRDDYFAHNMVSVFRLQAT
jgi:hypothetical protein